MIKNFLNYLLHFKKLTITTLCLCLLLASSSVIIAQDNSTAIRLRVVSPGLYVEHAFTDRQSLLAGVGTGLRYVSNFNSAYYTIYFFPTIKGEFRNYFSSNQIMRGAYLSAEFKYRLPTAVTNPFYTLGTLIGVQKSIGQLAYWNVSIGAGIKQQNNYITPAYLFNLEIGIAIGG